VAAFMMSSFGLFVMDLFHGLFTAPSWPTFTVLAWGGVLASARHTLTPYLWLTGATTIKPFSRFYVFLGGALYQARWQLWARIIRLAAQGVPAADPSVIESDDSTKNKAGTHIEGVDRYRNGAGSARQEYRRLRGLNFVWGIMRVPWRQWPGHGVSVPIGLSLYLKEAQARKLQRPYHSRSALAREIVDFVAAQLPDRRIQGLGAGGYAPQESLQGLPASVHVVSRMLIPGKLYAPPPQPEGPQRGRPPQKGPLLGSPKTFARKRHGWQPHPTEAGALVQAWEGLWHSGLPGRVLRVVVVRRPRRKRSRPAGQHKAPPPVAAFFTTDLSLSLAAILAQYRDRWAVAIAIRATYAFDGRGQDQCRKVARRVGANPLRLVLAAARTLWFVERASRADTLDLQRYRPWYRQKCAPSQLDVVWVCREALHEARVFPIPRFTRYSPANTLP
jgi:hypothetical protein